MYSLDELSRMTETGIGELEFPARPERLYRPVRYTLESGGKRVRPLLTPASCLLFTDRAEKALPAAMGIEVFHNFTLLHDDIMDRAELRRGRPTVHSRWNDNVAILSGDAMVVCAYDLISRSEPDKLAPILRVFNALALGVCEGQQYDMDFEETEGVTVERYIEMIRLKTSVMVGGAARIGAIAGSAPQREEERLYDFGVNLGLAFQLQDDVLDTYGDEKTFGKQIGGDIVTNKKTFLLIRALELAKGGTKNYLQRLLSGKEQKTREGKIAAVRAVYDAVGVRELAEREIERYFDRAETLLGEVEVPEARKGPMREIMHLLVKRNK